MSTTPESAADMRVRRPRIRPWRLMDTSSAKCGARSIGSESPNRTPRGSDRISQCRWRGMVRYFDRGRPSYICVRSSWCHRDCELAISWTPNLTHQDPSEVYFHLHPNINVESNSARECHLSTLQGNRICSLRR